MTTAVRCCQLGIVASLKPGLLGRSEGTHPDTVWVDSVQAAVHECRGDAAYEVALAGVLGEQVNAVADAKAGAGKEEVPVIHPRGIAITAAITLVVPSAPRKGGDT